MLASEEVADGCRDFLGVGSYAKCPVLKKWISALGRSRLKASAPAGRKNGSTCAKAAESETSRQRAD